MLADTVIIIIGKRFKADVQLRIGIDHFLEACWVARYTTLNAAWSEGNTLRLFTAVRITLFSDSAPQAGEVNWND